MRRRNLLLVGLSGFLPAFAIIFANVRGVVQDPQNLPIAGAEVEIRARASAWSQSQKTNAGGEFQFGAIPVGQYIVTVHSEGFALSV